LPARTGVPASTPLVRCERSLINRLLSGASHALPVISLMKAAERLGICVGSAKSLVLKGYPTGDAVARRSPTSTPI
jgi:hypothetical protein